MRKLWVEKNTYRDSVSLMRLAGSIRRMPGMQDTAILMGTPANKDRLAAAGFDSEQLELAGPEDICIGLDAIDEVSIDGAEVAIREFLRGKPPAGAASMGIAPRTLESARRSLPKANLVSISLPGAYAAREAEKALDLGMHVFLFSDNVPIAEEARLKTIARERGLLLMGPDCGTAWIHGTPLGFCNAFSEGEVGIVAASGTGAQAVACRLASLGTGISNIIGTGGRDLSAAIGGISLEMGMHALSEDPKTKVIILVSKPAAPEVGSRMVQLANRLGKPVVFALLGGMLPGAAATAPQLYPARTLMHAADLAAALVRSEELPEPLAFSQFSSDQAAFLADHLPEFRKGQRFVRGLYSGGTLAGEAAHLFSEHLGEVRALSGFGPVLPLEMWDKSDGHSVIDLGDERFTQGRPHPMIDFSQRIDRLEQECSDPSTAVILMDVMLGSNAEMQPAAMLIPAIRSVSDQAAVSGRALGVVLYLCGTEGDPQGIAQQEKLFRDAGCFVYHDHTEAVYAAAWIARHSGGTWQEPAND